MPIIVEIPRIGEVEFPDGMSDQDISSAIEGNILPQHVEEKRQEAQSFQEQSAEIIGKIPKTWMEQASERTGQQKRVPITTIAPSVAMPWPIPEAAPTIPYSPLEPLAPLPRYQISEDDSTAKMVAKSAANLAIGLPEFATTTLGIATAGAGAIPKAGAGVLSAIPTLVSGAFAVDLAHTIANEAPDLYYNWDNLSKAEKVEGLINNIGTAALAGMLAKHTKKGVQLNKEQVRQYLYRQGVLPTKKHLASLAQKPLPPAMSQAGMTMQVPQPPRPGLASPIFAPTPTATAPSPAPTPTTTPIPSPVVAAKVDLVPTRAIPEAPVVLREAQKAAAEEASKVPKGEPGEPSAQPQRVVTTPTPETLEPAVGVPASTAEPPKPPSTPLVKESQTLGGQNATEARKVEEGLLREREGIPQGEDVPANVAEVRQGEGERPSGGGGVQPTKEVQPQDAPKVTESTEAFDFGLASRESEARFKRAMGMIGGVDAAEMKSPSFPGLRVIISRDPSEKGKWRATRIDESGPIGHNTYETLEQAVSDYTGGHLQAHPSWANDFEVTQTRNFGKGGQASGMPYVPITSVGRSKTGGVSNRLSADAKRDEGKLLASESSQQPAKPEVQPSDSAKAEVKPTEAKGGEPKAQIKPEELWYHDATRATQQVLDSGNLIGGVYNQASKGRPFTNPPQKGVELIFTSEISTTGGRATAETQPDLLISGIPPSKLSDPHIDIMARDSQGRMVSVKDAYIGGEKNAEALKVIGAKRLAEKQEQPKGGESYAEEVQGKETVAPKAVGEQPAAEPTPKAKRAKKPSKLPESAKSTIATASEKVSSEIADARITGGKPSASDIKKELISRIEKEIESAPTEAEVKGHSYTKANMETVWVNPTVESVEIDIPGDGNFKIRRTKEALGEILKRAKRLETKPAEPKPQFPRGSIKSSEKVLEKQRIESLTEPPAAPEQNAIDVARKQLDDVTSEAMKRTSALIDPVLAFRMFNALVNLAKAHIAKGVNTFAQFVKAAGLRANQFVRNAWNQAKTGRQVYSSTQQIPLAHRRMAAAVVPVAGPPRSVPPTPPSPWQVMQSAFRKYFTSSGLRPPSFKDLENTMNFTRTMYSRQMDRLNSDLIRAVRKVYGISGLRQAMGAFRNLPQADVQLWSDYLKGNVFNPAQIPGEIRGVLDNMRAVIDGASTELANQLRARAAALPQRQRALANALIQSADNITQNLNHYLHRSYAFFDSDMNARDWYWNMPESVRLAAEQYKQANTGTGAPLSQQEAQTLLMRWLEDLKPTLGQTGAGTGKLGAKDMSILMRREAIPEPLRALLGEYNDPLINFTKTISKLAQHTSAQKFLNDVRELGLRDGWLFEKGKDVPGFQVEIAGAGSDPMHPMSGLRTSPEIAEIFTEYQKQARDSNWLLSGYYRLNAISKFAATGQSLMTQQRNLMGQPFFWGMSGHWSLDAVRTAVGAMREELFKRGDVGRRAYLDDASKYGVIGDTARHGELAALFKDAEFQTVAPERLSDWSLGRLIRKYGYEEMGKIYRASDEFGKLVGWEAEKRNVAAVNPTWTPEQVKTEAARRIRNFYPTYSMVPKAIQELRKLPVGPFVSFAYESLRTSAHAIGQSISELRSANPVERKIGAKRLASQLATLSAPTAISALTATLYGVSSDEQDDFRLFMPEWSENAQFMWLPSQKGERNTVNLSYLNPYQYTDVIGAAISGIDNDDAFFDVITKAGKEALSPYLSEQLMATAIYDVARGSKLGVWNEQDDGVRIAQKIATRLGMPLVPGTVQRLVKRTIPSFYQIEQPYGRKLVPTREIARELTGISLDGFDYKVGLGWGARQFSRTVRDSESIFREDMVANRPMTEKQMFDSYMRSEEARKRNWTILRDKYVASLRRGLSVREAEKAMTDNGIGRFDAESIAKGIYIPNEVSRTVYDRAKRVGKTIPVRMIDDYRRNVVREQTGRRAGNQSGNQ